MLEIVGVQYYNNSIPKTERKTDMKRWIKMTLLLLLALTLLCGCGKDEDDKEVDSKWKDKKAYSLVAKREYNAKGENVSLTEYTYDASGNLLREQTDLGFFDEYSYMYDTIFRTEAPIDGTIDTWIEYGYDENNYLNACQYSSDDEKRLYWNSYDKKGHITARGNEGASEPFLEYEYDHKGRLVRQTWSRIRLNYSYNKEDQLDKVGVERNYQDGENKWEKYSDCFLEYDHDGNLIELKVFYGEEREEDSRYEFEYDNGSLEKKLHYEYDEFGEHITITMYKYDENGNIAEAKVIAEDETRIFRYEYEELELSREDKVDYFQRNTMRWYIELIDREIYLGGIALISCY